MDPTAAPRHAEFTDGAAFPMGTTHGEYMLVVLDAAIFGTQRDRCRGSGGKEEKREEEPLNVS